MKIRIVEIQNTKGSQTVEISDGFKINDNKVYIKKIGNALQIIPFHDPWKNFANSLNKFTNDFMEDYR